MALKQFQVDAFASEAFRGNPAAVIVTEQALPEALMRAIAAENNLSETAYLCPQGEDWHIRWFTPTTEIDLCGHATLASAWVLATEYGLLADSADGLALTFQSRSGALGVTVNASTVSLDFPAQTVLPVELPNAIAQGLDLAANVATYKAQVTNGNYLLPLASEAEVAALAPDFGRLNAVTDGGIIVTAPADGANDFVSRFFAPYFGIDEDPVTGSAHCALVPFWADRLHKQRLTARQISARGGELQCALNGARVALSGQAVTVNEAEWRLA